MADLPEDLNHILNHTLDIWPRLANTRTFLTGGTGFFGTWLLETFAYANLTQQLSAEVVVLTRNIAAFRAKAPHLFACTYFTFVEGDVQHFDFPEGNFDYVIHAATDASAQLNAENPLQMVDTIVNGTRRTLEFAVAKKVKSYLLTSSGAVYGKQPSHISHITEDENSAPDPVNPHFAYAEGKRLAELLGAVFYKQFQVPVKIARCFAFVGPHLPLDTHFAIGNFINNGLKQEPIIIKGDGTPFRSYLYAADLVIWLLHILVNGQNSRAYNVGSDEQISIGGLAKQVAAQFKPQPEVQILTQPVPGAKPEQYVPAVARARQELGLAVYTNLQESIRKTIEFYRATTA